MINGESGVTPATLSKVEAAIEALGYERNDLAASLRSGVGSNTIGLVIEDVANPFYARVAQAVEDIAREHSSLLITTSAREDPSRERELVTALLRRRVDALLIVPAGPDHRYIARAGFVGHTVFLDRPPAKTDADTVLDRQLGRRAACGYAPAGAGSSADRDRRRQPRALHGRRAPGRLPRAFELARADAGARAHLHGSQHLGVGPRGGLAAAGAAAQLRPTAIFAANNRCTVGAMHALHGGDSEVALVGFDEFELADLLGVTVVRTDPYRIGQVAAQLAFSRIAGDERPPQRVMLPVDLVARGSGEIGA